MTKLSINIDLKGFYQSSSLGNEVDFKDMFPQISWLKIEI